MYGSFEVLGITVQIHDLEFICTFSQQSTDLYCVSVEIAQCKKHWSEVL